MKKILYVILFLLAAALVAWFYFSNSAMDCEYHDPKEAGGLVPNEKAAVQIAEAVLTPIYGEQVLKHRPFIASIQDSIWTIEGSKNSTAMGGVPIVKLLKRNGAILKCYHTK